jgi:AraC family transcriptional regulator
VETAAAKYQHRLHRVLGFIDAHLEQELRLECLGAVAAFSKYHFHRQFAALFGLSAHRYVELSRIHRAAQALAFRDQLSITAIALASGYEAPEAFARAFRRSTGQSPSEFRRRPHWHAWLAAHRPVTELRRLHMQPGHRLEHVQVIEFPATRVAMLEHRGDPALIGDSVRRFIAWRRANRLPPALAATYNILYDDPEHADPEHFRIGLAVATDGEIAPNSSGIVPSLIPGGSCAVLRITGPEDTLGASAAWLYGQWLPQSGRELRDYPLFLQRLRFFPDVAEHEAVSDLLLPLA